MGRGDHWELVRAAAGRSGISVVELTRLDDADRVRDVVDRVWGEQAPPREIVRALQHAGSVLYGAEDGGGELIGFVWGFLGWAGGIHLHSHMLGVVPGRQDGGIGIALKLAQRAACLDNGIDEVRWTYDPLVARNARFNLLKLGAEAFRLLPGFYGEMADRLNRGDRSDRFEVRWLLVSDRVDRALQGSGTIPGEGGGAELTTVLERVGDPESPEPKATGRVPTGSGRACVEFPSDHFALRGRDPELGRRWREETARAFQACFDAGLVAACVTEDHRYMFEPPEPGR
jgi:predicted GNAT superfamily acetyltransferase